MFRTVKAQKLIDKVRKLSDMEQSQFVTDDEICSYINDSIEYLYSYFLSGNCDLGIFSKTVELPVVDNKYLAPLDLYKVIAIINHHGKVMLPSASLLVKHIRGGEYLFEEGFIYTSKSTNPLTLRYLPTPTLIPLEPEEEEELEEIIEEPEGDEEEGDVEDEPEELIEEPEEEFKIGEFKLKLIPLEEKYLTLDAAITVMKKGENPITDLERDRDATFKRLQNSLLKNLSGANHRVILRSRHR